MPSLLAHGCSPETHVHEKWDATTLVPTITCFNICACTHTDHTHSTLRSTPAVSIKHVTIITSAYWPGDRTSAAPQCQDAAHSSGPRRRPRHHLTRFEEVQ